MDSKELIASIEQYATLKNIDKPTVARIINEVFSALILKTFGSTTKFNIVVNHQAGDLQIFRTREIVTDDSPAAQDPNKITLSEARKIAPDFEVGEEVDQEIPLESFKFRARSQALQFFRQKTKEIEEQSLYQKYERRTGEIITVEVRHKTPSYAITYDQEKNELLLPRKEQIPQDKIYPGQTLQAIVHKVEKTASRLSVILSRTSPLFLEKLLYREIPEIREGIVTIKKIVRRPGERAKVAVESNDDRIDPIGAIVGPKGTRISSIREQICYEPIDIVHYSDNLELYIKRALSPAKVRSITITPTQINLTLDSDQIPLAIGTKGQNIDLASKLLGKYIQIESGVSNASQEDVSLEEFGDEIEQETLQAFKAAGLHTGKEVLALSKEELQQQTKLVPETLERAYKVIQQEFDLTT